VLPRRFLCSNAKRPAPFTQPASVADPQPGTRPAPELARHELVEAERDARPAPEPEKDHQEGMPPDPREPVAVLADILGRDATEFSALELQRRNLVNADHLAVLNVFQLPMAAVCQAG
jgi:hypothetical protein